MATEMAGYDRTTPQPTDISAPPTPSLSFSNFRLASQDSMSSLSSMSYYDSSPILRDFQELTLSLTDVEDDTNDGAISPCRLEEDLSLFVCSPHNENDYNNNKHANFEYNTTSNSNNNNDEINDEDADINPFLMGLEINIPHDKEEEEYNSGVNDIYNIEEIESCDEEDDEIYTYGEYGLSDFETETSETETNNYDRKFIMKKYEYIENIGIGAFGIVDKVYDRKNMRYVAIKQSRSIGEEILKQFRNEQEILGEFIDCKYIINLYDYGKNIDANQICLGLEYMDIGSLCNIKSYSIEQIKYICKCILLALIELHDKLYVHNDIKPENILINTNGNVKLIDFGCTMKLKNKNDYLTKSIGSIRYLSYEKRFCSPIKYNCKSDIYSFGITISQIYNKKHYKNNNKKSYSPYNHYFQQSKNNHYFNSNDPLFNDFISKTLIKDPIMRYSAKQLINHPFLQNVPQKVQFTMPSSV